MERSKRLHNFNLSYLRWGHQRFLGCVKLHNHHHHDLPPFPSSSSTLSDRFVPKSANSIDCDQPGGEENPRVRATLFVIEGEKNDVLMVKPWNLRTRRAPSCGTREEKFEISVKKSKDEDGSGGSAEVWQYRKLGKVKFSASMLREEI